MSAGQIQIMEQYSARPQVALSVIDSLARALHVNGDFPGPLGDLDFEILAMTAPSATAYDPPRPLNGFTNRSGYMILDGTYTNPIDAAGRSWPLDPGTYRVRVRGDFYQDAQFDLQWPPPNDGRRITVPQVPPQPNDPGSVELLPSSSYPFPDVTASRFQLGPTIMRGSALQSDGSPVVGVLAEVINLPFLAPATLPALGTWPFTSATTDVRGGWTLVLPDRRYLDNSPEIPAAQPITKQISVRIQYPAGPVTRQVTVQLGTESALKNTALRGQVRHANGMPIAGAVISTSVNALTSTSRADGVWFLYFDLNQVAVPNLSVTATLPDGTAATALAVSLVAEATVVVPPFQFP